MDLSIGEVAHITGLPVKTIRYYADIGLVPEALRTGAGYRRYDDAGFAASSWFMRSETSASIWRASAGSPNPKPT